MRYLFVAAVLIAGPSFAETTDEKAQRCGVQRTIVDVAVTERASGSEAQAVQTLLISGDQAVGDRIAPSVQPLVDWVYTLDTAQLVPEVGEAFEQSCLNY